MNIAAKTFKDFVSSLKQASSKGFNKPIQINYQYGYFLAELQEGEVFGYKGKLDKLSGDETEHLFNILEDLEDLEDLVSWEAEESTKKVEKVVDEFFEKEDIVIEVVKPETMPAKPKRNSRKKV